MMPNQWKVECQEVTALAAVIIGYQREAGRNVESLADSHHRPQPEHLLEGGGHAHEIGYARPYEETAHDEPLAVQAVGDDTRNGTHESVNVEEDGHQPPEVGGRLQFGDVHLHGFLHGAQHLAVHIVEQGDAPQQGHYDPGINFRCLFHYSVFKVRKKKRWLKMKRK